MVNATTDKLTRLLELIAKEVNGELQINTLLTFLFIAERGKCTQKDVEEGLKTTTSSASRNVSFWTYRRFDRGEGMNMVERVQDDFDRRLRNLTLTKRGREFYKKLSEA